MNVASYCGFTESTYPGLVRLHDILSHGDYFNVLAFPCNDFGEQEPGDAEQIAVFLTGYKVEFPVFAKVEASGEDAHPLYKNLIGELTVILSIKCCLFK